jgi:hypothetical protein
MSARICARVRGSSGLLVLTCRAAASTAVQNASASSAGSRSSSEAVRLRARRAHFPLPTGPLVPVLRPCGVGRQDGLAGRSAQLPSGLPLRLAQQPVYHAAAQLGVLGQRPGLVNDDASLVGVDPPGRHYFHHRGQFSDQLARQLHPRPGPARGDAQLSGHDRRRPSHSVGRVVVAVLGAAGEQRTCRQRRHRLDLAGVAACLGPFPAADLVHEIRLRRDLRISVLLRGRLTCRPIQRLDQIGHPGGDLHPKRPGRQHVCRHPDYGVHRLVHVFECRARVRHLRRTVHSPGNGDFVATLDDSPRYARSVLSSAWPSLAQAVRRFRSFRRLVLEPGASSVVTLTVGWQDLGFWTGRADEFVVEPGRFEIHGEQISGHRHHGDGRRSEW